jgi:hypothetical protein
MIKEKKIKGAEREKRVTLIMRKVGRAYDRT